MEIDRQRPSCDPAQNFHVYAGETCRCGRVQMGTTFLQAYDLAVDREIWGWLLPVVRLFR